ncbi:galectin-1-like [Aquarana catesbeiana]|uniref:galectin-1-like n=1 Tax=Aquarana catesbeiana TaxID=8400 RepID=UPI003CC924BD
MADNTINTFGPGYCMEVEGFIPVGCKAFSINLGTDDKNFVIHFGARFDVHGDIRKIVLNTKVNDIWGEEQKKSFFPLQEGSDTKVSFTFEQDTIIIRLPTGNPFSFPVRFPIMGIPYLAVINLHLKSVIVNGRIPQQRSRLSHVSIPRLCEMAIVDEEEKIL